ncbi:IclR family transcriptional regulator [Bradyrhizobium sp. NP1]|uniref:IclR family transcriptional regulator n=1 Tax=Bradyrhizobium sp. NP1 TaxID=3049772 RepID=UPI0025A60627|nr:IclR family transcriptional regulator [Bradyrhizobium sp. NP1]WJR80887.1 IclR family transcriptional regulator [Bradyrhizobium sp. NP1]
MDKVVAGSGSQTVSRALNVLEMLGNSGEMGVREIARNLGIAPSMAQRLVNALARADFVEKAAESTKWKIGYKAFQVGSAFLSSVDLNAATTPELHFLADEKQVNSFLGVLRDQSVIYLAAVQSGGGITITNAPGSRTYLHSTALGKALLSSKTDEEAGHLLGPAPYKQLTRKTRRSFAALVKDLNECRRLGYAISDEENIDNVFAAGAPVRNASGQTIAALSGAVPRQKLSAKAISELCQTVKDAAARASRRLGAPG